VRIVLDACVPALPSAGCPETPTSMIGRCLLRAHSNSLEHLVPLVPRLLVALQAARPGDVRVVGV
jgi:hypothetical protein